MSTPLVSVLVPFHNGQQWAGQLEQTLQRQTFGNWEAVVVGSDSWGHFSDTRFDVRGTPVRNTASNTNTAAHFARGQFFLLLDQDDELFPDCIEKLLNALDAHPEWAAVTANQLITEHGENRLDVRGQTRLGQLLRHQFGHPLLVRASCWWDMNPDNDHAPDHEHALRLTDRHQIGYVDAPLYKWHLHGDNVSLKYGREQADAVRVAADAARARRAERPTVAFVLPCLGWAGGITVVIEAANAMRMAGWAVCLVDASGSERIVVGVNPTVPVYSEIPWATDLAIGTSWDRTWDMALTHERRGNGFAAAFAQAWEADWSPLHHKLNPGFKRFITCSPHVQARLKREWNADAVLLPQGIDTKFWEPQMERKRPEQPRVLMIYRTEAVKQPADTMRVAEELAENGFPVTLIDAYDGLPGFKMDGITIIPRQSREQMRQLYREHAFYVSVNVEGQSVCAMEAASQGCVPVCWHDGAEWLPQVQQIDDKNSLVTIFQLDTCWSAWEQRSTRMAEWMDDRDWGPLVTDSWLPALSAIVASAYDNYRSDSQSQPADLPASRVGTILHEIVKRQYGVEICRRDNDLFHWLDTWGVPLCRRDFLEIVQAVGNVPEIREIFAGQSQSPALFTAAVRTLLESTIDATEAVMRSSFAGWHELNRQKQKLQERAQTATPTLSPQPRALPDESRESTCPA